MKDDKNARAPHVMGVLLPHVVSGSGLVPITALGCETPSRDKCPEMDRKHQLTVPVILGEKCEYLRCLDGGKQEASK